MKTKISAILMFLLLISGCATTKAPFQPPTALLYTDIKAPLKTNLKNSIIVQNQGKAQTISFQYGIWSFSAGDSSARNAMINAFVNQADYADYEYFSILFGLYQKTTVIAYGKRLNDSSFISIKKQ